MLSSYRPSVIANLINQKLISAGGDLKILGVSDIYAFGSVTPVHHLERGYKGQK